MNSRISSVLLAAAMAIGGAAALRQWFVRFDPQAISPMHIGREEALLRAMQLSARYGAETAGWTPIVAGESMGRLAHYQKLFPADPAARLFSTFQWDIAFKKPGTKTAVRIVLSQDGSPREWEWKDATPTVPPRDPNLTPEDALRDFAGPSASSFNVLGKADGDRSWEFKGRQLTAELDVVRREGRIVSVQLQPHFDSSFDRFSSQIVAATTGIAAFSSTLAIGAAALVVLLRSGKRNLVSRPAVLFALLAAAFGLWAALVGSDYDTVRYLEVAGTVQNGGTFGIYFAALFPALGIYVAAGAANAVRSSVNRTKWFSMDLLLTGRWNTQQVGAAIAAGIAFSIALAAIPYLTMAIVPAGLMDLYAASGLASPWPVVHAFTVNPASYIFLGLAFYLPATRRLRIPILKDLLFVLGGILVIGVSRAGVSDQLSQSFLAAALIFAATLVLYLRFDLLAAIVAVCAAHAVRFGAVYLVQSAAGLHSAGIRVLAVLGATLGVAALVAWRGKVAELGAASGDLDTPLMTGDRDRLNAEFQVARKAQQAALPPVPADRDGYSFSAACVPATQVGGDLYDFLPLPGGRIGIVVADVSGKGVPAALYMMVTKGLLSAGARDSGALKYILEQINFHLYRTCKRKVFVTLAAVALDPAAGKCQYGRAGHNPVLWRRVSRGETVPLKPKGLGLGMVGPEAFSRSLEMMDLDLEPGDALVLYSDGVTEAVNAMMDQFGEERLANAVGRTDGLPAGAAGALILQELAAFVRDTPPRDDVTLVVVRAGNARKAELV